MVLINEEYMFVFFRHWDVFEYLRHFAVEEFVCPIGWFLEGLLFAHVFSLFHQILHYYTTALVTRDRPDFETGLLLFDYVQNWGFSWWWDGQRDQNNYSFDCLLLLILLFDCLFFFLCLIFLLCFFFALWLFLQFFQVFLCVLHNLHKLLLASVLLQKF